MRYSKLIVCLLLVVPMLALQARAQPATINPSESPNILLILVDDAGFGDVEFNGNRQLKTPRLNQLSRQGTHFNSFYVSPVCAPTRASLLTGRYHQRTGVIGVVEGREFMSDKEVTLAEVLKNAGYATGLFGKWHLGENYPFVPTAQGFNQFIGFLDGSNPYFDTQLLHNGQSYPTQGYLTDVLTDQTIRFMKKSHRSGTPFFAYLSFNAPHSPLEVPAKYVESYRHLPEPTRKIYGMMAAVDQNIGRLVYSLQQMQIEQETMILFLSDNGPLFHGAERYHHGLKGKKYTIYEGGMRVPFFVRWPGHVPSGREVKKLAAHIDLFPTILDVADVRLPDSLTIDGRSLRPLLQASSQSNTRWSHRTLFMGYPGEPKLSKIQKGNKLSALYPGMAVTSRFSQGRFKMVDGDTLYNISHDPDESNNIAERYPDILQRLDEDYQDFQRSISNSRLPYPRVQVGHPEENPTRLTAHWARLSDDLWWEFSNERPGGYRRLGVHGDWISRWPKSGI